MIEAPESGSVYGDGTRLSASTELLELQLVSSRGL